MAAAAALLLEPGVLNGEDQGDAKLQLITVGQPLEPQLLERTVESLQSPGHLGPG